MLRALILAAICAASIAAPAQAQNAPAKYNLIVVDSPTPSPAAVRLLQWFETDQPLATLRSRTGFHAFTTSNPLYRERYAKSLPPADLPILALAAPDGRVAYKASGANIPATAAELFAEMREAEALFRKTAARVPARPGPAVSLIGDCPTCPNQPSPPAMPQWPPSGGGIIDRVVDGAIPDTVNVAPNIDASGLGPWLAAIALGLLLLIGVPFLLIVFTVGAVVTWRAIS